MTIQNVIENIIAKQREFAFSNKAHDVDFRKEQLSKLKRLLKENEDLLFKAIYADFKKSSFETYMTELSLVYHEIDDSLKNLKKWSQPKRVSTGVSNFPAKSYILPEPRGTTLVIGAWNYPYQLTLVPIVSSLAAGNTVIAKPSEMPEQTAKALSHIINSNFDPGYLHVIEGGVEVNQEILKHKFDKIFFTGSTAVGRIVAEAAAKYLTPLTLELGGKSPCFVLDDVPLEKAAQRIVWGKFLNAGQTCIAPDYLLVQKNIYDDFLSAMKRQIEKNYGSDPKQSEGYVRIINNKHWLRLKNLIDSKKVYTGGDVDESERYIAPTILRDITFEDEIMKEEIFGPILPVIPFENIATVIKEVKSRPRPLALYVFSEEEKIQNEVMHGIAFGGGAVNDVVMHISNPRLPFGGNGESGMGNYHGEAGFRAFSHYKSIMKKNFWFEPPIKYPPFSNWKKFVIQKLLG